MFRKLFLVLVVLFSMITGFTGSQSVEAKADVWEWSGHLPWARRNTPNQSYKVGETAIPPQEYIGGLCEGSMQMHNNHSKNDKVNLTAGPITWYNIENGGDTTPQQFILDGAFESYLNVTAFSSVGVDVKVRCTKPDPENPPTITVSEPRPIAHRIHMCPADNSIGLADGVYPNALGEAPIEVKTEERFGSKIWFQLHTAEFRDSNPEDPTEFYNGLGKVWIRAIYDGTGAIISYDCELVQLDPEPEFTLYKDCDPKATVEAQNTKNPNLDSRDIYVFSPGETAPSNLSVSWPGPESVETSTSLAWNACYLLTIREIEGAEGQTIWLNYFDNNPIQLMDTTDTEAVPFHALEVDAGPNDLFAYIDIDRNIYISDRSGSWKWDLGIQGYNVEWFTHDNQFSFTDLDGVNRVFDVDTRQYVKRPLGNDIFRAHTRNGMQFAPSVIVPDSLAVFSQERIGIPSLRLENVSDIAVNPIEDSSNPESAIFIRNSQVWMTENWMQESIEFSVTNDENVWENPDWRK